MLRLIQVFAGRTFHYVGFVMHRLIYIIEPHHEKTCPMPYANNKGADQPMHSSSLIGAFVVCCLDGISKISSLYLASVATQAGLCLTWSQTTEDTFSCDQAYMIEHDWLYRNDPRFLDRQVWANSVDPDQTAPRAV